MKQGHFAVLFIIVYLSCFFTLYLEQRNYDMVLEEKCRIEKGMKQAIEYAANELIPAVHASKEEKCTIFQTAFFEAFYIYMGVMDDTEEQQRLKMHVPMLVLVQEDGAFFYYAVETLENGVKQLRYEWTELQSFVFPEDCSEEKKKSIIAETLEETASGIITSHNYIAAQYGISYNFYVPDFLQDTARSLDMPVLFAVFQGWPLTAAGNIVYENCVDTGVYVQKVKKYIIELPTDLEDSFCYYHEEFCELVQRGDGNFLKEKFSKEQAVRMYGALSCTYCGK
ncbi:MAG: hypothetical protein J6A77_13300 [Lachnospiraceae bacterium]|nr:hypothetical protein [Lachnospiraceae bacterium]